MKQRNTKLTQEEFDERMKNINPNIKVLSEYTRRKDKTDCICLICDTRWTTTFDKLLEKRGCPKCLSEIIIFVKLQDKLVEH